MYVMGHHFWGGENMTEFHEGVRKQVLTQLEQEKREKGCNRRKNLTQNYFSTDGPNICNILNNSEFFPLQHQFRGKWRVFNFKTSQFCTNFTIWSKQATEA